jgi:membrane protease YdiL (CAAX protease family)
MSELDVASGSLCGAALFVTLAGGRVPLSRPAGSSRALALRWVWLGGRAGLEELVWRGLVLAGLAVAIGAVPALLVSSAGFALWHRRSLGRRCAVHVLTGLMFGATFLVAGLGAATLAHGVYNVLVDWAVHADRGRL